MLPTVHYAAHSTVWMNLARLNATPRTASAARAPPKSPEERFDRLTRMCKRLFGVPIALVSLVDENRQWFKSCVGLSVSETPRDISFCGHAILGNEIFVIPDAAKDERFADNPLVLDEPHIRFYAGCPLRSQNGCKLGTLCIIDRKPRELTQEDLDTLKDLASMVERELEAVQLATLDDLTKISNRRGFMALAQHSLNLCSRQETQASLGRAPDGDFQRALSQSTRSKDCSRGPLCSNAQSS